MTSRTYRPPHPTPIPKSVAPETAQEIAALLETLAAGLRSGQLDQAAVRIDARRMWPMGEVQREPVVRVAVQVLDDIVAQAHGIAIEDIG